MIVFKVNLLCWGFHGGFHGVRPHGYRLQLGEVGDCDGAWNRGVVFDEGKGWTVTMIGRELGGDRPLRG